MNICIVGDSEDLTLVYIKFLLEKRGLQVLELKEDELGRSWYFSIRNGADSKGLLFVGERSFPFESIHGAFLRYTPTPGFPYEFDLDEATAKVFISERRQAINHFLCSLACPVINEPLSGMSNGSKPFQMKMLEDYGFQVPKWTVTNDHGRARDFTAACPNGTVYKSISGLRSYVRKVDQALLTKFKAGTSPVILQEYIAGDDVRVHTINEQAFPTRIITENVDYRFENEGASYAATTISETLREQMCAFAKLDRLTIAGFDFKVTPEGEWYCLEMNPVPTFLPYEMSTGQQIGNALIDYLHEQKVALSM